MKYSTVFTYWSPVILWIGFVFWMSTGSGSPQHSSLILEPLLRFFYPSMTRGEFEIVHALVRKLAHVIEFFIGGLLFFRAYRKDSVESSAWRWAILAAMSVVLVGAMDELHQYFVATRNATLVDVGIDFIGGALAQLFCIAYFHHSRQWKLRKPE